MLRLDISGKIYPWRSFLSWDMVSCCGSAAYTPDKLGFPWMQEAVTQHRVTFPRSFRPLEHVPLIWCCCQGPSWKTGHLIAAGDKENSTEFVRHTQSSGQSEKINSSVQSHEFIAGLFIVTAICTLQSPICNLRELAWMKGFCLCNCFSCTGDPA